MSRLLITSLFFESLCVFVLAEGVFKIEEDEGVVKKTTTFANVRMTAYNHAEADHIRWGRKTASGTTVRYGKMVSVAADWSRWPLGTEFRMVPCDGKVYVVEDYGGALVGTDTLDIYKPTIAAMNSWGLRWKNIEVVKWGCLQKSFNIINNPERLRYRHVRRMREALLNML